MTEPVECPVCGRAHVPAATFESFVADYEARRGVSFEGRRPGWVTKFCSERCRYADMAAKAKAQRARSSARRSAKRKSDR